MKIEHLRYFLTIVRVGSTNKAADELFLTSQNLGLIIKNIENELGKSLFIRTTKGMHLTAEGEKFVPYAQEIVATYDRYLSSDKKRDGILNFYTTPALAKNLKGLQEQKWAERYYLSIIKRSPAELMQMLQSGVEGVFFFSLLRREREALQHIKRQAVLFSETETLLVCHENNYLLSVDAYQAHMKDVLTIRMENYNAEAEKSNARNEMMLYIDDIESCKRMMKEKDAIHELTARFYKKHFAIENEWAILHRKMIPTYDFAIFFNVESSRELEAEIKAFIDAAF